MKIQIVFIERRSHK